MLSAEEIVSLIAAGWSVRVVRREGGRLVKFSRLNGTLKREMLLPKDHYEAAFERAMSLLAEGHPQRYRVEMDTDFYGNLRGMVRTGLFGAQCVALEISPRHLALLQRAIDERHADLLAQ